MAVHLDGSRAPLTARVVFAAVAALFAFYGAVILLAAMTALALSIVVGGDLANEGVAIVVGGVALVSAGMVINVVLVRTGYARWSTLGWQGLKHTAVEFGRGTMWGIGMGAVTLAIAVGIGGATVSLSGEMWGAYLGAAGAVAMGLSVAAMGEELIFRGYPLARLAQTIGRAKASGVLAALFALMHIWNPEVSSLGLLNIALASLVMSAAFFTSGGLPIAWGLHFGWNAGLGVVVDAPVSGIQFAIPGVEYTAGATLVTGGPFGPEGGLAATIALAGALALFGRRAVQTELTEAEGEEST